MYHVLTNYQFERNHKTFLNFYNIKYVLRVALVVALSIEYLLINVSVVFDFSIVDYNNYGVTTFGLGLKGQTMIHGVGAQVGNAFHV